MGKGHQRKQVWWLYRLKTKSCERLYVGISGDPGGRIEQHRRKEWGPLIEDTRTEMWVLNGGAPFVEWKAEQIEKEKIQERGGTLANTHHNTPDWGRIDVLLAELAGVELPATPRPRPVPVAPTGWSFTRWAIGLVPLTVVGAGAMAFAVWVAVFGSRWAVTPKISNREIRNYKKEQDHE